MVAIANRLKRFCSWLCPLIPCCPKCTRFYDCLAEARGYLCGTPGIWRCPACASGHAKGQGLKNYPEISVAYLSEEESRVAAMNRCGPDVHFVSYTTLHLPGLERRDIGTAIATAPDE